MPLSVHCPECRTPLEVDDEHRDWKVRCPQCRHEFRPSDADAAAPAPFELVDEAEDDAPRRRKRRRRERDREYDDEAYVDPDAGEDAIAKPAMSLEVASWIYILLALAVCGGFILYGIAEGNQPPPKQPQQNAANEEPPEFFIFVGCCLAVFTVPYFVAVAYGARKMRHLTSQGWGQTAAIMAIASIVLFGVFSFPMMGIGIWTIVAMNKNDVRAAFKRQRRRSRRNASDDD